MFDAVKRASQSATKMKRPASNEATIFGNERIARNTLQLNCHPVMRQISTEYELRCKTKALKWLLNDCASISSMDTVHHTIISDGRSENEKRRSAERVFFNKGNRKRGYVKHTDHKTALLFSRSHGIAKTRWAPDHGGLVNYIVSKSTMDQNAKKLKVQ